jgi:hypothetical protein
MFYYGFISGLVSSYIIYQYKYHIINKTIDYYVDIKYLLNSPLEQPKEIPTNKSQEPVNLIEKDNFVFINDGQYIYWHPIENEIKHSINSQPNNNEFKIISGNVENTELFLQIINKFAGFMGDFNGNVPTINILNIYEPLLNIKEKIVIENSNYEEFIIN